MKHDEMGVYCRCHQNYAATDVSLVLCRERMMWWCVSVYYLQAAGVGTDRSADADPVTECLVLASQDNWRDG